MHASYGESRGLPRVGRTQSGRQRPQLEGRWRPLRAGNALRVVPLLTAGFPKTRISWRRGNATIDWNGSDCRAKPPALRRGSVGGFVLPHRRESGQFAAGVTANSCNRAAGVHFVPRRISCKCRERDTMRAHPSPEPVHDDHVTPHSPDRSVAARHCVAGRLRLAYGTPAVGVVGGASSGSHLRDPGRQRPADRDGTGEWQLPGRLRFATLVVSAPA